MGNLGCNCCKEEYKLQKSQYTSQIISVRSDYPKPTTAVPINETPKLPEHIRRRIEDLGQFHHNQRIRGTKLGPYRLKNGIIYQGQWKNGRMHGSGRYFFPGNIYLQVCSLNGKVLGKGRLIKQNGDYYEGDIINDEANGFGQCVYDGIKYKGQFINNLPHGSGHQQGNDYVFTGSFYEGQKIKGVMKYGKNFSQKYEGQLQKNKPHGIGRLENQIGVYEGQFQNGKKHGKGQFFWKDGHKYMGNYQNDVKSGYGILVNPSGKQVINGMWKMDKPSQN